MLVMIKVSVTTVGYTIGVHNVAGHREEKEEGVGIWVGRGEGIFETHNENCVQMLGFMPGLSYRCV